MKVKTLLKGYAYVVSSAFIFGLMPLMAKFLYDEGVNPQMLVLLRNVLSLPLLGMIAKFEGYSLKISSRAFASISIIAVMGCCITPVLLYNSYEYIASGTATVFHFIYPAVVFLGDMIFHKKKSGSLGNFFSLVICFLGICMFYTPGQELNLKGSIFALLSGITYGVYIIMLSRFRYKEHSSFVISFYIASVCSVVMFIICAVSNRLSLPQSITGFVICILFAILINVCAVVLFQKGTFIIGGSRAAILSTIEPITSVFVGVLIFNEQMSLQVGLGAFLVIMASVLITITDMRKS